MDEKNQQTIRKDFEIPEENLRSLQEKIEKLNRKAKKLKLNPIAFTVGEAFMKSVSVIVGYKETVEYGEVPEFGEVMMKFYPVTIEGDRPQIAGYTFIATVDHLETGTNVFRSVEGFKVDERFRNVGALCEHCQKIRRRKDTYVVQHESGAQKQVGRSCLKDFLGGKSPAQMAGLAEMLMDAMSLGDEFSEIGGGNGVNKQYAVQLFSHLAWGNKAIREHGWLSSSKAYEGYGTSTNARIISMMEDAKKNGNSKALMPEERDYKIASQVISWARNLSQEEVSGNDYLMNLKATMEMDYVQQRSTALVVSAIPAYHRAQEKEMEAKQFVSQKNSQYVGEVGQRLVFDVTLLKIISVDTEWGGMHIHRMITPEGNVITAFNVSGDMDIGKQYQVKGTIKKHEEYKGVKQTIINRATLYVEKPKKSRKKKEGSNVVQH